MSEGTPAEATKTSETASDENAVSGGDMQPADESALGDTGKRALAALRSEIKELKARLKATETPPDAERDASESAETPSVGARDAAADVTPERPRFQGSGDGGAVRVAPDAKPQLSADDLQRMKPKQIEAARREGRLRNLLRGE